MTKKYISEQEIVVYEEKNPDERDMEALKEQERFRDYILSKTDEVGNLVYEPGNYTRRLRAYAVAQFGPLPYPMSKQKS